MTDAQLRQFERWFTDHVRGFQEPDPSHQRNLDLKEFHTARVGEVMARITSSLGLSANACRIAAVTALFHDLGRFPQYQRYRTFRDPDSENHAKLSLRELTRHRVLHCLEPAERQLIGRAIIYHNRLRLPDCLDPETLLHSRLIRDADKVDILRVMAEEYGQPVSCRNPVVTLGLKPERGVRDAVYSRFFEGRIMNHAELITADELKLLQMSWVFDINFRPTFVILRERGDIERIAASLPDTPLRQEAKALVQAYIHRRLNDTSHLVGNEPGLIVPFLCSPGCPNP